MTNLLLIAIIFGAAIVSSRWKWGWLIGIPAVLVGVAISSLGVLDFIGVSSQVYCPRCKGVTEILGHDRSCLGLVGGTEATANFLLTVTIELTDLCGDRQFEIAAEVSLVDG